MKFIERRLKSGSSILAANEHLESLRKFAQRTAVNELQFYSSDDLAVLFLQGYAIADIERAIETARYLAKERTLTSK